MSIYPPNNFCQTKIEADPDIGGRGIIAAFVATSWLTVLLACIPACFYATRAWKSRQNHSVWLRTESQQIIAEARAHKQSARFVRRTIDLLGLLCDIQAVTGISIMISGFAKWGNITLYHAELVQYYWTLTLDSFWAARINYMDDDMDDPIRTFVRRLTILFSCILAVIWQFRNRYREDMWNDDGGPCYRFLDGTQEWPWTGGIMLFSVALAFSLLKSTGKTKKSFAKRTNDGWGKLLRVLGERHDRLRESCTSSTLPGWRKLLDIIRSGLQVGFTTLCIAIYWLLIQWLAIWSYGDGFYPFTWFVYLCYTVWNTLDVVSLVDWNKDLIENDEKTWGFGQVLPLVMLLQIVFGAIDVFRREYSTN